MYYFKFKSVHGEKEYVVKAGDLQSALKVIENKVGISLNISKYYISMYDLDWIEKIPESL